MLWQQQQVNTTHFSYNFFFHMLWQQQYHLLFIQRLSSIGYGNGNKANFSYKFTTLVFHMLWQRRNNSLFVHFEDPVHDGDVPALHLEHYNLPHTDGLLSLIHI